MSWLVTSGLLGYLSHRAQGHLHRDGTAHRKPLGPTASISNQENTFLDTPEGQSDRDSASLCRASLLSGLPS